MSTIFLIFAIALFVLMIQTECQTNNRKVSEIQHSPNQSYNQTNNPNANRNQQTKIPCLPPQNAQSLKPGQKFC